MGMRRGYAGITCALPVAVVLCLVLLTGPGTAFAVARSSASYSVTLDAVTAGGGAGASSTYRQPASAIGEAVTGFAASSGHRVQAGVVQAWAISYFTVTTQVIGNSAPASITVTPVNTPGLEPGQYAGVTQVTLTVNYNNGVDRFDRWVLNGSWGYPEESRLFLVNQDSLIQAYFVPIGGEGEGAIEGEGAVEGEGEGEGEGAVEGEGEGEGAVEGEGEGEGAVEGEGEGEGAVEGEGEGEGTVEGEGEGGPADCHSADQNCDNGVNLSELLRVIQFYNSNGFHCADPPGSTEDGFAPGPGADHGCAPHASDYHPTGPDWDVDLSELLRLIQFYNSGGYHACPGEGTEDGYCPGAV